MSEKKVAVVTGGSKGIGRAICMSLAKAGMHVFFNYSSSDDGASKETENLIAQSASQAGGTAQGMRVNVSVAEEVDNYFKNVLEFNGRLDVLVNNAGITRDGLIARMKEKDWNEVLDVNLKGAFLCIKAATRPMMKQKYGRIINISSVVGEAGNPGQANYVASKAGLIGLTKSVALELATRNITANVVAPGYIETEMTANFTDKHKQALLAQIPAGKSGVPEDVAGIVKFLASDEASYITGQVIHVNGGMYT